MPSLSKIRIIFALAVLAFAVFSKTGVVIAVFEEDFEKKEITAGEWPSDIWPIYPRLIEYTPYATIGMSPKEWISLSSSVSPGGYKWYQFSHFTLDSEEQVRSWYEKWFAENLKPKGGRPEKCLRVEVEEIAAPLCQTGYGWYNPVFYSLESVEGRWHICFESLRTSWWKDLESYKSLGGSTDGASIKVHIFFIPRKATQSPEPTPTPEKETCACEEPLTPDLTPDKAKNDIKNRYGVEVLDSNIGDWENPVWSIEELLWLKETLCKLPDVFRQKSNLQQARGKQQAMNWEPDILASIEFLLFNRTPVVPMGFLDDLGCKTDVKLGTPLAFTLYFMPAPQITFCGQSYKKLNYGFLPQDKEKLQYVFVHEQVHTTQQPYGVTNRNYNPYNETVMKNWISETGWTCLERFGDCFRKKEIEKFFAPEDIVSEYGRTNPFEDMAESGAFYAFAPDKLQQASPRRFNFIKDRLFGGQSYGEGEK